MQRAPDYDRPDGRDIAADRLEDEITPRRKVAELRSRFQWLENFTDDELREITVRAEGDRLEPGMEYVDLSHPEDGMIIAPRGKRVPHKAAYVCRDDVPQPIWDKLVRGHIGGRREAI